MQRRKRDHSFDTLHQAFYFFNMYLSMCIQHEVFGLVYACSFQYLRIPLILRMMSPLITI